MKEHSGTGVFYIAIFVGYCYRVTVLQSAMYKGFTFEGLFRKKCWIGPLLQSGFPL